MLSNLQHNPKKRKLSDTLDSNNALNIVSPPSQRNCQTEIAKLMNLQKCSGKDAAQVTQITEQITQALIGAKELKFDSIQDANTMFCARGAHIPYPECGDDIRNDAISLTPPSRIEVGWGLIHRILRKSDYGEISIDLIVQIPSITFHTKDYLEYRYLRKRILYLSYLVLALKDANKTSGYSYHSELMDGDEFRPIVSVACSHAKCTIRLIPAISPDLFPIDKLSLNTCRADRQTGTPTPMYNSSLIDDAYHLDNLNTLKKYAVSQEGFKEALILGSAWLSRIGFSTHLLDGGFGEKEWALLQSYLIENLTSTQDTSGYTASSDPFLLFKSVLNLIANIKFPRHTDFLKLYRRDAQYNILFKMSRWSFVMLRHHSLAVISFDKLGLSPRTRFQRIFETPPPKFADLTMSLLIDPLQIIKKLPDAITRKWNIRHFINDYCYDLFSKGLGNRYKTMAFSAPKLPSQKLKDASCRGSEHHGVYNLVLSITLDEKNCARVLDCGPDIGDPAKTADFRDFWGERAELRRFKDGRVMETVKWDTASSPTKQILSFLCQKLARSFQTNEQPTFYGCESDLYLASPPLLWPTGDLYEAAVSEFEIVVNTIRQLKGFPLGFKKISGTSPGLSFTSVKPPFPCSRYLETPLEGELELESSNMWPVDLEQRKRSEYGLLLKLRSELEATGNFVMTRVGIATRENLDNPHCFLDLLTKRQYYFRFRLKRALEVVSRGVAQTSLGQATHDGNPLHSEQNFHLESIVIQKCHQHQYFASSIRILKKWFQSHHLASFFNDGLLELFATVVFSPYSPLAIPGSTYCGFGRIITHLSHWDWRRTPLEIEILRHFSDNERAQVIREFGAYQSINRNGEACLSIVVPVENGVVHWIQHNIPRLVAIRMTQLARETHSQLSSPSTPLNAVFHPDMTFFDFVIVLERKSNQYENNRKYINVATQPRTFGLLPLYERFIRELKAQIEEYVLLFPSSDGFIIGGLWKPARESDVLTRIQNLAESRTGNTIHGKAAILGLIMELGRGLVDNIQVPRCNVSDQAVCSS